MVVGILWLERVCRGVSDGGSEDVASAKTEHFKFPMC